MVWVAVEPGTDWLMRRRPTSRCSRPRRYLRHCNFRLAQLKQPPCSTRWLDFEASLGDLGECLIDEPGDLFVGVRPGRLFRAPLEMIHGAPASPALRQW